MTANTVTTTVAHSPGEKVNIGVERIDHTVKEISVVGRLNTKFSHTKYPTTIDVIDFMSSNSATSNRLFKVIKDLMDYRTNESTLPKPVSKAEQKKRSKASKQLKGSGVVKKNGQRTFMVNPYLIVPPTDLQEDIVAKWNSLP